LSIRGTRPITTGSDRIGFGTGRLITTTESVRSGFSWIVRSLLTVALTQPTYNLKYITKPVKNKFIKSNLI